MIQQVYYTYIIRLTDNSLYTGITTNLKRRMTEHQNHTNQCAKYTKCREFCGLLCAFKSNSRSLACSLEYKIKQLPKYKKEQLILDQCPLCSIIDESQADKFSRLSKAELSVVSSSLTL